MPQDKLNKIEGAPSIGAYDRHALRDILEIMKPFDEEIDFEEQTDVAEHGFS